MKVRIEFSNTGNTIGSAVLVTDAGAVSLGEVVQLSKELLRGDGAYEMNIKGLDWSLSLMVPEHQVEML